MIKKHKKMISAEFSDELFKEITLYKRINDIKHNRDTIKLDTSKEKWFGFKTFSQFKSENIGDTNIPKVDFRLKPFKGVSIKAYTNKIKDNNKYLELVNYHYYAIKVVGFGYKNDSVISVPKINLEGYRDTNNLKNID